MFAYSFGGAVPVASSVGAGYFAVAEPGQVGEGPVGVLVEMIDLWVLVPAIGQK